MQILILLAMGAGFLVQMMLKSRMNKYSHVVNPLNLTGKEIAEKMLKDNGIFDVQVISTPGQLTDHYNPTDKTVNLSEIVYGSNTITAAAVSAHEVGHAVQHATAYGMLGFRSNMVPLLNITNKVMPFLLLIGFALFQMSPLPLIIGITFYGLTTIFALVTLPVEFDASNRALAWLDTKGLQGESYDMAKDGLKWAAMTYVVNAIASVLQLLYYISLVMGRRRD
ncbi:MAG: zinc metallopeptidase [Chitinophagales bacterium]|nr:zinc metallopeptidase [Chitinophagales bacterium]